MTESFETDWSRAALEDSSEYSCDTVFEEHFRNIKLDDFSSMWTFVSSLGLDVYNLNVKFEGKFYKVIGLEANTLNHEEAWKIVKQTIVEDSFIYDPLFEAHFDEVISYELSFEAYSKTKMGFVNSEIFEKHFTDAVKSVEFHSDEVKDTKSKSGNRNGLKSLLEARLKRLKQMETYIKTVKENNNVFYECKTCGFKSNYLRKLFYSHVKPKHIVKLKEAKCNKKKKLRNIRIRQESDIERRFICGNLSCSKMFSNKRCRKRHMMSVHRGDLKCKCDHCDKCFRDRLDLMRHLTSKHKETSNYKCSLCAFKSAYKRSLVKHIYRKHKGSNLDPENGNITCDTCGKSFIKKYAMMKHMAAHKAIEIGYRCVFCSCVKLENHVCQFTCSKCERSFNTRADLRAHALAHEKILNVAKYLLKIGNHVDVTDQILDIRY